MREIIAQPNQCHIGFISHDGTEKGSHSGAKSWAEEPSMVVRLDHAKDEDGRKVGVEAKFLNIERRMLILGAQSGSTF